MNNKYINSVRESLDPGEDTKERILGKVHQRYEQQSKWEVKPKAIAAAAVIAVLTLTTTVAVAYSNVLQEIILGSSRAAQVEIVNEPFHRGSLGIAFETTVDEGLKITSYESVYTEPMSLNIYSKDSAEPIINFGCMTSFTTFKANEWDDKHSPFLIKKPSYLPLSELVLGHIMLYEQAAAVSFLYYFIDPETIIRDPYSNDVIGAAGGWSLTQTYAGEGGFFELDTTYPIEKVMIGNVEALLLKIPMYLESIGHQTWYQLFWVDDGYVFWLDHASGYQDGGILSLDILMAIAESIR
jgi:hypothetical protein